MMQALLLRQDDPELRLEGEQIALEWVPGGRVINVAQVEGGAWSRRLGALVIRHGLLHYYAPEPKWWLLRGHEFIDNGRLTPS
jgi:hypothetical protein